MFFVKHDSMSFKYVFEKCKLEIRIVNTMARMSHLVFGSTLRLSILRFEFRLDQLLIGSSLNLILLVPEE